MKDKNHCIKIKNLRISTKIGLPKEERQILQSLNANIKIYFNIKLKSLNDNIDKTINYFEVCQHIRLFCQNNSFKLIETLADKLANEILQHFSAIKVDIELKKYIIADTDYISFSFTREL